MVQVVNYERMARLRPTPYTTIPFNLNTLSVIILVVAVIGLYKRHIDVRQSREQSRI
jgi:hypothetical protein